MPDFTKNYGLITPGTNEFFSKANYKYNMDKIDEELGRVSDGGTQDKIKIAKLEKELNDYKNTLAQVNVNQEAKQAASGYGQISLPPNAANRQVSVSVKGRTLFNYIDNGVDYANWILTGVGTTKGINGIHLLGSSPRSNNAKLPTNVKPNTQYTLIYNIKTSTLSGLLAISSQDFTGATVSSIPKNIGINKILLTSATTITNNQLLLVSPLSLNTEYIDFEVYGLLEGDYTNDNSVNYPMSYGTKSTVGSARVKSVGKNLFDINDIKFAIKRDITIKTTNDTLIANGIDNKWSSFCFFIQLKPNTKYTISCIGSSINELPLGFGTTMHPDEFDYGARSLYNSPTYVSIAITTDSTGILFIKAYANYATHSAGVVSLQNIQIEEGDTATEYEPYVEDRAYVTAKKDGKILELRSLPNGAKDEISLTDGKMIKRISDEWVLQPSDFSGMGNGENVAYVKVPKPANALKWGTTDEGKVNVYGKTEVSMYNESYWGLVENIGQFGTNPYHGLCFIVAKETTLEQAREQLAGTKLIYQLAEPEIIPVQVSGNIVSQPSGTIYVDHATFATGIYTDGMNVLYSDLPIKFINKITRIDYQTGLEYELDPSKAIVSDDKLSFTHEDLVIGDIVFFDYEYDLESTEGKTTIEYYDSRYVIKDSATGKFYKWSVGVADGQPSIELVEV